MTENRKQKAETAMSLTELLVATVLVGIVMIGMVSIDYALRQSRKSASGSGLLAMQVSAAMMQITRDANLAVGDATDRGVEFSNNNKSICFRHDTAQTPGNYTDDTWVCYFYVTGTRTIGRCYGTTANIPPNNWGQCSAGLPASALMDSLITVTDSNYFTVDEIANKINYIEINLTSRPDPRPASPEHPITNPSYTLTSRVFPQGLSQ